ncbi:MAG TPA: hypothetical protein VF651_05995 [Gammaproteobacteria bacterium]
MFRRHRRLLAAGLLLALAAAWMLPAQACMASPAQAATHAHCPDCPYPCGSDASHGPAAANCAASMQAAVVSAPVFAKAVAPALASLPAIPADAPRATAPVHSGPVSDRPPVTSLNIRFCTFQI